MSIAAVGTVMLAFLYGEVRTVITLYMTGEAAQGYITGLLSVPFAGQIPGIFTRVDVGWIGDLLPVPLRFQFCNEGLL